MLDFVAGEGETFGYVVLELLVELPYSGELLRIPLAAVGESHRLHVFPFEHEAQGTVLVHREHMVEVVRVVFHRPADMRVFPELGVETIVIPFMPPIVGRKPTPSSALRYPVSAPNVRRYCSSESGKRRSSGNLSNNLTYSARFRRAPAQ